MADKYEWICPVFYDVSDKVLKKTRLKDLKGHYAQEEKSLKNMLGANYVKANDLNSSDSNNEVTEDDAAGVLFSTALYIATVEAQSYAFRELGADAVKEMRWKVGPLSEDSDGFHLYVYGVAVRILEPGSKAVIPWPPASQPESETSETRCSFSASIAVTRYGARQKRALAAALGKSTSEAYKELFNQSFNVGRDNLSVLKAAKDCKTLRDAHFKVESYPTGWTRPLM